MTGPATLPPWTYARPLLTRAVLIWLAARLGVIPLIALAQAGSPILLSMPASVGLVAGAAAAAWLEVLRRDEQLFLGNLGVGQITLFSCCLAPIALAERGAAALLRVLA